MIPESAEVKRESWLRGDWRALADRLPSREWLRSHLPKSATDWYMWAIIGIAGGELLWSMYCKLTTKAPKMRPPMTMQQLEEWRREHGVSETK